MYQLETSAHVLVAVRVYVFQLYLASAGTCYTRVAYVQTQVSTWPGRPGDAAGGARPLKYGAYEYRRGVPGRAADRDPDTSTELLARTCR